MPTFSIPNSSHSTACVDTYLRNRDRGQSRKEAVVGLSLTAFSYRTLQRLEQREQVRSLQLKAVEAFPQLSPVSGHAYLQGSAASAETPIATLNQRFLLSKGKGWLFGNIDWLAGYRSAVMEPSHDLSDSAAVVTWLDST